MDKLYRLKDTFFQYLSPKRSASQSTIPDPKRRRTTGPGTPLSKNAYIPISEPRDKRARDALYLKINEKRLSPFDAKNPRKRRHEDDEGIGGDQDGEGDKDDWEDDNMEASSLGPEDSPSQITPNDGDCDEEEEDEESGTKPASEVEAEDEMGLDDLEVEISPEDKVEEYLARQAELALKREAIEQVKAQGNWHADEIFLFERLSLRGFEELLPATYQIDFPTLPETLFTTVEDKTFINSNCLASGRGVRALQSLLALGGRVKDKILAERPAERLITKEIQNYIKWSEMDGGYFKLCFIPILTVVAARPNEPIDSISKSITDQMEFLAERHREHLALPAPRTNELGEVELYSRRAPLLYGIIVAQTMAIFVTLDSSDPEAKIRHIAHFDFKEKDMDVWNGFALAIVVIAARNYMMSIKDEFQVDDESISDPDA